MEMSKALSIAFLTLLLAACKGDGAESTERKTDLDDTATSADFAEFYELFHTDSTFQVEHIAWPLDGNLQAAEDGGSVDVQWKPEDWVMHKPLELGTSFVREIDNSSPDLVIERIKTKEGSYIIERRFAKFGDMWTLIYYRQADMG